MELDQQPSINELREVIGRYFKGKSTKFVPGKTKILTASPTYGVEEIAEATDSLLSTNVTMGKKVKMFENMFAKYIGVNHGVMVNSGSSANLLAMSALTSPSIKDGLKVGDEVITPAVTWATTLYPISDVGAVPVIVDVNPNTYNIDLQQVEQAITNKTRAIFLVHLLGAPCDMHALERILKKHDLFLIEDCCEAHGAMFDGRKVGSFGHISTFSFYYSHHIATIEGGMLLTNIPEFSELAKCMRAFGWIRDLQNRNALSKRYPNLNPRFLFVNRGYCLRPTEIQGAFGIHQLKKLEGFIEIREQNAKYWNDALAKFGDYLQLPHEDTYARNVWFGYPLTVNPNAPFSRDEIVNELEKKGIETRPIMAGNITEQPVMKYLKYRTVGNLPNARMIDTNSFFFGNHPGIGKAEREYIAHSISEFIRSKLGN